MDALNIADIDFELGSSRERHSAVLPDRYNIARHSALLQALSIHTVTVVIVIDSETCNLWGENVAILYDSKTISGMSYAPVDFLLLRTDNVGKDFETCSMSVEYEVDLSDPMKVAVDMIWTYQNFVNLGFVCFFSQLLSWSLYETFSKLRLENLHVTVGVATVA